MSPLLTLIRTDLRSEWRQKSALWGVGLYAGSTVFAVYLMAGTPEASIWNALFWITQLFVAANTIAKSFLGTPQQQLRYYYTLVPPATYLLAKMLYSTVLMILTSIITLALFTLMLGSPLSQALFFTGVTVLGSLSLSLLFTFLAAIASAASGNSSLMAILGFPLVAPILMMLSSLSASAVAPVVQPGWWQIALGLLCMDALIVGLGLVLFPFLWKE